MSYLQYMAMRVAHRDLKPDNVVLDPFSFSLIASNYFVKLVNLGTSKTQVETLQDH